MKIAATALRGANPIVSLLDRTPAGLATLLGKESRVAEVVRPVLNRVLPTRAIVTVRSGPARGLRISIDPRCEKFYWTGAFEPAVQDEFIRLLRPGMSVWDIGAHAGFFTALAARTVGARGAVHAFEPLPSNRARVELAASRNGLPNVTVHDVALAARAGPARLYSHESSSMWTLVPELGETASVEVQCQTLDALADELGIPNVVKVDAEGAELDILRGGLRLLEEARVHVIVELTEAKTVAEARTLFPRHRFAPLGARHWSLEHDGRLR